MKNASSPPLATYADTLFIWIEKKGAIAYWLFAFLLGTLISRVFAPTDFFPLLLIIVPLWLIAIERAPSGKQAFNFGWWSGFGLLSVGLNWIGYSFTQQDAVPVVIAPFAIMALSGLLSIYIGLAFWLTWLTKVRLIPRIFVFAAIWTLLEIARGFLFTGFPWHVIGSMWANWLPVAQSASFITVYGLSLLSMTVAGSLVCLLVRRNSLGFVIPAITVGGFVVVAGLGYLRLDNVQTEYHTNVSLRLVQANIKQREKWISYLIENHFDKHMSLSRGSSTEGKADGVKLLIWPETSVQRQTFDREGSIPRWRLSRLLERGSYALVGAPRYSANENSYDFYNSLFAVNYKGDIHARYDKKHLVPFGEYLPFEGILNALGLSQLTGGSAFKSGDQNATIALPGVPAFSPLICYEIIFPGGVVNNGSTEKRPEWLLNITNDGWFGLTEGPHQHLALARFRAIEEGLPLVRNAGGGISAVIDPYGRTISQLEINRQGILDSVLPRAIKAPMISVLSKIMLIIMLSLLTIIIAAYINKRRQ
ncbi:apolipoprotein N-acyltransferase [Kordiimonas sp. SCSIO 12610]|uniref:apolipoprotein N-acyltransferase n=1 Tax=Kordiimonas sp. SCSIO 12610 TaxID=2829597 RepID=UPI00210C3957|nr:apolipoprotein N-acyltransferase [Kordiimonas sp. SCSIO 12610]UTW55094.1 apolipoprotein N-acyltransferase [Kordiimonas sp. SCSIO 12610]